MPLYVLLQVLWMQDLPRFLGSVKKMGDYLTTLVRQIHAGQAQVGQPGELEMCAGSIMHLSAIRSVLRTYARSSTIERGRRCIPVDAPVFKIGGRWRKAGCGGFDSHAFPPNTVVTNLHFVSSACREVENPHRAIVLAP